MAALLPGRGLRLFPVGVGLAGLVCTLPAHVDLAEVDGAGVVREPVDDRVGSNPVGQGRDPVIGSGLGSDDSRPAVLTVGEDGEQVAGRVGIDAWTPTGFVDTIRSGTMVYEERTGSGTGSQEVHPGI